MSDECTCEKCQAVSVSEVGASVWHVGAETPAESHGRTRHNFYLVVTDGGISLRQHSNEM